MAWSNKQKQIAARACKAAKIDDDARMLRLRQFKNAMYDRHGKKSDAPSSTSAKLTDRDFELFMAGVENWAGGQVLHYSICYWQRKAYDNEQRYRHAIKRLGEALERDGLIYSLNGFIARQTNGECVELNNLRLRSHCAKVLQGLKEIAKRNNFQEAATR